MSLIRTAQTCGTLTCLALLMCTTPLLARPEPLLAETTQPPRFFAPATDGPDLQIFKRAITSVWSRPAMQAETDMRVNASGQGAEITYRQNLQIRVQQPNQYQSKVTLIHPDGAAGVVYQVACDGQRVVSFRSGLNRYAVQPVRDFEGAGNDFPFLGLYAGALFLADPSFKALFNSITPTNGAEILRTLDSIGMSLTSQPETLSGTPYSVFRLSTGPESAVYRFFVDPATAEIGQIEMAVEKDGVKMVIIERIRSVKPATPTSSNYTLTLPRSAERVPELPVRPFYDLSP